MDKINSGEMPPKKKPRPDAQEAFAVASWVATKLDEATKAAQGAGGRVPMRRLNRAAYANTVRDLFSLEQEFARRGRKGAADGWESGAASIGARRAFSWMTGQLDRYLAVADMVLDEAVFSLGNRTSRNPTWRPADQRHVHGIRVAYKDDFGEIQDSNPTPGGSSPRSRSHSAWDLTLTYRTPIARPRPSGICRTDLSHGR